MSDFDLNGARRAGYNDEQIAQFLMDDKGLDYTQARAAGWTPGMILEKFSTRAYDPKGPAKALGSGLAEGAIAGTVGVPGDLQDIGRTVEKGLPTVSSLVKAAVPPSPSSLLEHVIPQFDLPGTQTISKALGTDYTPQTVDENGQPSSTERLIKSTAAGTASMLPGAKATMGLRAGAGAILGASGEVGSLVGGGIKEDSLLGRLVGQGVPLSLFAWMAMRKPQLIKVLQDDVKEIGEAGLRKAQAVADFVERYTGVRPVLSQALEGKTSMTGTMGQVSQTPMGLPIRQALDAQPPVAEGMTRDMTEAMHPGVLDQSKANAVAAAVEKAQQRPKDVRGVITKPYYDAAKHEVIPATDLPPIAAAVRNVAERNQFPAVSESGKAVESAARNVEGLATNSPILNASGKPFVNPIPSANLQILKREEQTQADRAANVGNSKAQAAAIARGGSAAAMRDAEGPLAAAADAMHARATGAIVEPSERSALAQIKDTSFAQGGPAQWNTFTAVIKDPNFGAKDIEYVGQKLKLADPTAFPAIARKGIEERLNTAFNTQEGRVPENAIGQVARFMGREGSHERDKYLETVKQVALSQGKDPVAAQAGADALAEAMNVMARDRMFAGRTSSADTVHQAGATAVASGVQIFGFNPYGQAASMVRRVTQGHTYSKVAEALTTPGGVDTLIKIAQWDRPVEAAAAIARGLIETNAQHQQAQGLAE